MKKHGLMFAGILILTFSLSFVPGLLAEEGHMHEMMDHGTKSMGKAADNIVIDPVCGMKIKPENAAGKSEYKGTTYYFCMDADKKTFDAAPEKYLARMSGDDASKEMQGHEGMEGHHQEIPEKAEKGEHSIKGEHHEMEGHEGHQEMMHGTHWMAPEDAAGKENPVELTAEALAGAAETFREKCTICHGAAGRGDGALSDSLNPKPTDLTGELTRSHPDGDLFYKISKGKGAMPAWDITLSEEERWGLVNFIRRLSEENKAGKE